MDWILSIAVIFSACALSYQLGKTKKANEICESWNSFVKIANTARDSVSDIDDEFTKNDPNNRDNERG